MRQLAVELGRSLLFDSNCWYCGRSIYLYANPNGGFAIFEDDGPPWPLHDCRGLFRGTSHFTVVRDHPAPARWPIPAGFAPISPTDGDRIKGTVVEVAVAAITIFTGQALYKVQTYSAVPEGTRISGIIREREGSTFIELLETLDIPSDLSQLLDPEPEGSTFDLAQPDLLLLEDALFEFAQEGSRRAQYVLGAIRCLSAARPLAALNLLLDCLLSDHRPPALARARVAEFTFRLLEELGGQGLAPRLWKRLRPFLGAVLEPGTDEVINRVLQVGRTPAAKSSSDELLRRADAARESDNLFLASLRKDLPAIPEWRSPLHYHLTGKWTGK